MDTILVKNVESLFSIIDSLPYIRFELGTDHENGSNERIKQVQDRIYKIFESIFSSDETIFVYSKDWISSCHMFGNTTPNYLYDLLQDLLVGSIDVKLIDEDNGMEHICKESYFKVKVKDLDYKRILSGICNFEQGREPSIGQSIYFISEDFGKRLYMYDDRGCDVHSIDIEDIRPLYDDFNSWILDYNKAEIDSFFC